jgi:hypothetical protein
MTAEDRLNKPACSFPVALVFGSRDGFASDQGGETLLNVLRKHNDDRVNLFRIGGDTQATGVSHNLTVEAPDETVAAMLGHFDGTITGRWEPTVLGSHITKPRPPRVQANQAIVK